MVNEVELHSETSIPAHLTQLRVRDTPYHRGKPAEFLCGAVGRGPETGPARKLKPTWIESKSNNESIVEHNISMSSMSSLDTDYSKAGTGSVCSVKSSDKSTRNNRSSGPSVNVETTGNSDSCGSLNVEDLNGNNSNAQIDDDHDDEANAPSYTISLLHRHGTTGQNKTCVSKDHEMNRSKSSLSSNLPNIRMNASYSKPSDFMSGSGKGPETPRRKLRTTPDWLSTSTLDTSSIDLNASSYNLHQASKKSLNDSAASINTNRTTKPKAKVKPTSEIKKESSPAVVPVTKDEMHQVQMPYDVEIRSNKPADTKNSLQSIQSCSHDSFESIHSNKIVNQDELICDGDTSTQVHSKNECAKRLSSKTSTCGKKSFLNKSDDDSDDSDDSEAEEQKYVTFATKLSGGDMMESQNHIERLSLVRKLDYGGSRPDDFMGGCGTGPTVVRRQSKATPSWLSQNQKEQDKQPKPVRRTHSSDITRNDGPDVRSCSRSKTMDSCMRPGTYGVADKKPENMESCLLSNRHDTVAADTNSDSGSNDKLKAATEVGTAEIRRGTRRTSSRDSEKVKQSTRTLLGAKENEDEESDEEVTRSSYYKPNEYLGGYKDKNSNRRTVAEHEERVTPIRAASYRRPGDFMGGGAIAPDNAPRRKSIDPSSIFGKK